MHKESGWYADCSLKGKITEFLVDSGSSCTMLDITVFSSLNKQNSVELSPVHANFVLADGSPLDVLGEFSVEIELAGIIFVHTVVVANLGGDLQGILGLDFIEDHDVVLRLSQGLFSVGDLSIQLHRETPPGCCRIRTGRNLLIQPRTVVVVEADVDQSRKSLAKHVVPKTGTIEGLSSLVESTGLFMARSLVTNSCGKVPVNLVNVHDRPVMLEKGRTLGLFSPIAMVSKFDSRNESLESNSNDKLTIEDLPEHIRCVLKEASELTAEQTSTVVRLILNKIDVFASPDGKLGRTELVKHQIDTGEARPIKQPARRLPWAKQEIADAEVDKMVKQDVIEESNSPWASPIVLVTKKDGSIRFCIDYRKLNDVTRKDAYPLPRIDDSLDSLGGSEWFCTMDLASGYWQIAMDEADKPKTAFVTRKGLYQFRVMPFGLSNAPATCERLMEQILRGLQWKKCLIYLDDVIVFGKSFEETLSHLSCVLERLQTAGLKLKPSKCDWFRKSVKFLGHVVSPDGISCDPDKISAVKDWPVPKSVTEVRSFLGFASYYRKFIPDYSQKAHALTNLTRKSVKFKWDEKCQIAFDFLKNSLVSAPVLAFPTREDVFILDTDASDYGIGGVLSQIQNGEERAIAYVSHTLEASRQKYCTTKKELFAVVKFVEHFKHYLYGRHFIIRTDHASLKWLKNFKNADGMLARWLSTLDTFDYEMVHRKGVKHVNADALSRQIHRKCPRSDCPQCRPSVVCPVFPQPVDVDDDWLNTWSVDEVKNWQREDPVLSRVIQWLENSSDRPPRGEIAQFDSSTKAFWHQWEMLKLSNGILHRKWFPQGKHARAVPYEQLVAPGEIRYRILKSLHDSPTGGHLGITKTVNRVRQRFYWVGYKNDITRWCRECDICAQNKQGRRRPRAGLRQQPVGFPLEKIAIDILGPLPKTENECEYIMVVSDYFTKWTEAYAIKNHTAYTVADVLVKEFISRFGIPRQLHSDQGREFESNLIAELCKLLQIRKTRTTPYNPKSDGLVERFNRTVQSMLTAFVNDARDDWDEHLPYVMMAYRASVQESTKCTPNLLMLGREVNLPVDLMVGEPSDETESVCPVEYVEWVRQATEYAFQFVQQNLQASAERQKLLYDRASGSPHFKVGETVWRYIPPKAKQKFGKGWHGPFLVTEQLTDVTYRIQKSRFAKSVVVHVDHLKSYEGTHPIVSWLQPQNNTQETSDIRSDLSQADNGLPENDHEGLNPEFTDDESLSVHENEDFTSLNKDDSLTENSVSNDLNQVPDLTAGGSDENSTGATNTDANLNVRTSNRPRKPKVLPDFVYY